jgi:hypothetical protein
MMTNTVRRLGRFRAAVALGLVCAALGIPHPVRAGMIGKCEVTVQKGEYTVKPLIPGQLTVRANLPSPGRWNGDKIIQSLKEDGTLTKLSAKYLAAARGTEPSAVPYFRP